MEIMAIYRWSGLLIGGASVLIQKGQAKAFSQGKPQLPAKKSNPLK